MLAKPLKRVDRPERIVTGKRASVSMDGVPSSRPKSEEKLRLEKLQADPLWKMLDIPNPKILEIHQPTRTCLLNLT